MRRSLSGLIEMMLIIGLCAGAALAFTAWKEYACGVVLLYSAVRLVLRGI